MLLHETFVVDSRPIEVIQLSSNYLPT